MRTTRPLLAPSLRSLAVMAVAGGALAPWLPPGMGLALLLGAGSLLPLHAPVRRAALLAGGLALLWLLQRLARLRDAAQAVR
jgi:hypothetical protein